MGLYFNKYPYATCNRRGIRYSLDRRQLIDLNIYLKGKWEEDTVDFLEKYLLPGDIVLEVGANVGAHTCTIAKTIQPNGMLYAFEPAGYARQKLLYNLSLNSGIQSCVKVLANPVTDNELNLPWLEIRSSFSAKSLDKTERTEMDKITTKPISIDQFIEASSEIDHVKLIKIDVDGYDYKVLKGATETLRRFRPMVFVEFCEQALNGQGDSIVDIYELLRGLGYDKCFLPNFKIGLSVNEALARCKTDFGFNVIFSPPEHSLSGF